MENIKKIAKNVRKQCELYAFSVYAYQFDFYKQKDLQGMCLTASFALNKALTLNNIKSQVIQGFFNGQSHVWIEIDNKIIDITATQFNINRKIYILDKNDLDAIMYQRTHIIKNIKDINCSEWHKRQRPTHRIINQILFTKKEL